MTVIFAPALRRTTRYSDVDSARPRSTRSQDYGGDSSPGVKTLHVRRIFRMRSGPAVDRPQAPCKQCNHSVNSSSEILAKLTGFAGVALLRQGILAPFP